MIIKDLQVPDLLVRNLERGTWTQPSSDALVSEIPFLDVPFCFVGSLKALSELNLTAYPIAGEYDENVPDEVREAEVLKSVSLDIKLVRGKECDSPILLPWIDLDLALCIGHHREIGDDHWVYLDYRESLTNPSVVASDWTQGDIEWRLIDPSFDEFAIRIGYLNPLFDK